MPESPGTLAEALIRLQASLPRITKDDEAQTGSRTYRYANLASIHDAVFPLLAECGLAWTCCPTMLAGQFVLHYSLTHAPTDTLLDGWYPLPEGATPQTMGGAITYARRYALCAVLGIAPVEDDDDAQAAERQAREDRAAEWRPPANPRTRKPTHHRGGRDPEADYSRPSGGDDDPWAKPLEDTPGSIEDRQRRKIMRLYADAGITDRADRLAYAMSKLDLPELASSNDLSYRQALSLIEHLEQEGKS